MQIYADNAATTKMSRTAIDAMLPYMETYYGNPSSLHTIGQQAAKALRGGQLAHALSPSVLAAASKRRTVAP